MSVPRRIYTPLPPHHIPHMALHSPIGGATTPPKEVEDQISVAGAMWVRALHNASQPGSRGRAGGGDGHLSLRFREKMSWESFGTSIAVQIAGLTRDASGAPLPAVPNFPPHTAAASKTPGCSTSLGYTWHLPVGTHPMGAVVMQSSWSSAQTLLLLLLPLGFPAVLYHQRRRRLPHRLLLLPLLLQQ